MRLSQRIAGILIVLLAASGCFKAYGAAAQGPTLENLELKPSESLIQTFLVIVGEGTVRFNLVGGSSSGIKSMRVSSGDAIVIHQECYGAPVCQAVGTVVINALPYDVLTVSVISGTAAEQREKVKLNLTEGNDKVYMIATAPGLTSLTGPVITSLPEGTATSTLTTPGTEITIAEVKPPTVAVSIEKQEKNVFAFNVLAEDAVGVDFIEIMEDGKFMDVELCEGVKQCKIQKKITIKTSGDHKYMFKAMNEAGKYTFQEETVSFEE